MARATIHDVIRSSRAEEIHAQQKHRVPSRRGSSHALRALREAPDTAQVTNEALAAFTRSYPDAKIEPLVVVIAAYNEADNIGAVIDEIPDQIAGIRVTRLVIDDGSTDCTTEVASRHGALVCTLSANRGHGVALRLGYRIAREGGARYIATLDGDGQWDPADLPVMVSLLERGDADFVIGSRQLGRTQNTDLMRNMGVRFFACLVSRLTGTRVTDTSSGLRAMTADLTGAVRQTQPQYQTSELLIGAILHGYRIVDVPTTMRPRMSGTSKKGRNAGYGLRYARVIAKTWRRERRDALPARYSENRGQSITGTLVKRETGGPSPVRGTIWPKVAFSQTTRRVSNSAGNFRQRRRSRINLLAAAAGGKNIILPWHGPSVHQRPDLL